MEDREDDIELDLLTAYLEHSGGDGERHGSSLRPKRFVCGIGKKPRSMSIDTDGDDSVPGSGEGAVHRDR
jgi:hypothetical protein